MSVPTKGETFQKLMEHLRLAQEDSATIAHLENALDHNDLARQWLQVAENFKQIQYVLTKLAARGLH